jgi:hypothetical protein
MCLIISKPKGVVLEKSLYEACWDNNPDGSGFFWHDGCIHVRKAFGKFETFWKQLAELNQVDHSIVFHFRWASHGAKSLRNCHPFTLKKHGMVFCHNGVINKVQYDAVKSDTLMFAETILEQLPVGFLYNKAIVSLIEDFIGWSKLVFMDSTGKIMGVKAKDGVEDLGCWFSNTGYKTKKYISPAGGYASKEFCVCCGKNPPMTKYASLCAWCNKYAVWDAVNYGYMLPEDKPLPLCPVCKKAPVPEPERWCSACLKTIQPVVKEGEQGEVKHNDTLWFVAHKEDSKIQGWLIGEEVWLDAADTGYYQVQRKRDMLRFGLPKECFSIVPLLEKENKMLDKEDDLAPGTKIYFQKHLGDSVKQGFVIGEELSYQGVLRYENGLVEWLVGKLSGGEFLFANKGCFSLSKPTESSVLLLTEDAIAQLSKETSQRYEGDV